MRTGVAKKSPQWEVENITCSAAPLLQPTGARPFNLGFNDSKTQHAHLFPRAVLQINDFSPKGHTLDNNIYP
jgi:hypothetical protein